MEQKVSSIQIRHNIVEINYHENYGKDQMVVFYKVGSKIKAGLVTAVQRTVSKPKDFKAKVTYIGYGGFDIDGEYGYLKIRPWCYYHSNTFIRIGCSTVGPVLVDLKTKTFYLYNPEKRYISTYMGPEEFLEEYDRDPGNQTYRLSGIGDDDNFITVDGGIPVEYAHFLIFNTHNVKELGCHMGLCHVLGKYYFHHYGRMVEVDESIVRKFLMLNDQIHYLFFYNELFMLYLLHNKFIDICILNQDYFHYEVDDYYAYIFTVDTAIIVTNPWIPHNYSSISYKPFSFRDPYTRNLIKAELKERLNETIKKEEEIDKIRRIELVRL